MADLGEVTAGAAARAGVDDDTLEPIEPPDHEELDADEPIPRGGEPSADARGWGPGWPTDNSAKTTVVRAAGIALRVHKAIAPIVERCVVESAALGYVMRAKDSAGFVNRPIMRKGKPTNKPSNHSWGLAVDINWTTNPQTSPLKTDMPPAMVELWKTRQFRWGGDYKSSTPDAMHYEFMGTPEDAARIVAELGGTPIDLTEGNVAAQPPAKPKLQRKDKGPAVELLQERLNANGATLEIDGVFGEATENAVKAFQAAKQLEVDGIVGPKTWEALG